tara:strand:+ start:19 stop:942 length:924 start_codon:yes stop_codon:yes gene_type:complete
MKNRRKFIKNSSLGIIGLSMVPNILFSKDRTTELTILHSNDTHSHIFPVNNGKYKGFGGMAQRAQLIKDIRKDNRNVLLLDAGDIFQGTPYFNFFGGEVEYKLMSKMKYDAVTLGNHDFDNGIEGLNKQLKHASFDFINSNYDFNNTVLKNKIKKYRVFVKDNIKIGVFGLGIELEGLVPEKLCDGIIYKDPIKNANYYSSLLKDKEKCNLVVCLSHLGLKYDTNKISDIEIAKKSKDIDVILGGHTHTFLEKPIIIKNKINKDVLINQVGWAGINLGRIDFIFRQNSVKIKELNSSIFVKKKYNNG